MPLRTGARYPRAIHSGPACAWGHGVSNPYGSATTSVATVLVSGPHCTEINLYAGIKISRGTVDKDYLIQYTADLRPCPIQWTTILTTNLTTAEFFWLDPDPANRG